MVLITSLALGDRIKKRKAKLHEFEEKISQAAHVVKTDVKKIGKTYGHGVKEEAKDIKKIMESPELVFYQTDAFAIVLRKLGGLYDFLAVCDKLTKEGYTMVNSEDVKGIPGFGIVPVGSFYYFQHKKYIY